MANPLTNKEMNEKFPIILFRLKRHEHEDLETIAESIGRGMTVNGVVQLVVRALINPNICPTAETRKAFKFCSKLLLKGFD